ncbi:MAG: chemotaxis protein CheA, partial [Planctomycetales bacterium]|nr:chemotaxis protein CheA [Planctomycetales bacterium]
EPEYDAVVGLIQEYLQKNNFAKEICSKQALETAFGADDAASGSIGGAESASAENMPAKEPPVEEKSDAVDACEGDPTLVSKQSSANAAQVEAAVVEEPAAPLQLPVEPEDEQRISEKYLGIFVDEAEMALEELSETLLSLPLQGAAATLLATCHRLKGSSASIGLNRGAKLIHTLEDALQEVQASGGDPPIWLVDASLMCVDVFRDYVDQLRAQGSADRSFEEAYRALLLRGDEGDVTVQRDAEAKTPQAAIEDAVVSAELKLTETQLERIARQAASESSIRAVLLQLNPGLPLADVKLDLIYQKLDAVGGVLHREPDANAGEEALDGSALFVVPADVSRTSIDRCLAVDGVLYYVVEDVELEIAAPAPAPVAPLQAKATSEPAAAAVAAPEATRPTDAAKSPGPSNESVGDDAADDSRQAGARNSDARKKPAETIRVEIDRLDQLMNLAGQLVINKARFGQISESLKAVRRLKHTSCSVSGMASTLERFDDHIDACLRSGSSEALEQMKSQTARLHDDLAQVYDEIAKLSQVARNVVELNEAVHQLGRIADGIQKSVMDTRMVPIGPLFGRFKRVIRDITRGNGRDIVLEIAGENTELDKRMIDELGDPLIHLVRNAADHGIETPEDRVAAGKPPRGVVSLDAFHQGNQIVIQVRDDGRGMDPEKIRKKAIEKGIVSDADAEKLSESQSLQLIWEPGFSTAEQVTEVSGRGMGMDIVRAKIEDLNGSVEVDSRIGTGTSFTIKLPLTLAILPSLLSEIDGDVYAVPIESVIEIVQVSPQAIVTIGGKPVAHVRDRVVAVVTLGDLFDWSNPPAGGDLAAQRESILVICGTDKNEVGLVVDQVLGEEDVVIKSLAENFQTVEGVSGASILGDGRVSLILDVHAMLDRSNRTRRLPYETVASVEATNEER